MKNKKKNKATQLIDESGKDFILDGRHRCLCEASKHDLVNNCLSCGRIVCEQEGAGPCFTCGTYVLTKEERKLLLSDRKEARERIEQLTQSGARLDFIDKVDKKKSLKEIAASLQVCDNNPGLSRAIEHKNKLLEFDQNSVARTKVYDDQVDYFALRTQNFISNEARKAISDKVDYLVENKFNRTDKIVLDLENLTVTDYAEPVIEDLQKEHKKLEELSAIQTDYKTVAAVSLISGGAEHKKQLPPPIYVPNMEENSKKKFKLNEHKLSLKRILSMDTYNVKVQDKELEKIDDRGMCLAMHQPYASLLVAGIKRFEGRTWYTPFKGRLWIYAAMKMPTMEEIQTVEMFYQQFGHKTFPKQYPTGVMVGCVTVEDSLPVEVYREQYPEAMDEVGSPYVLLCEYPIAFSRPLPVTKGGGKQIYKLEPTVHKACKKMLGF